MFRTGGGTLRLESSFSKDSDSVEENTEGKLDDRHLDSLLISGFWTKAEVGKFTKGDIRDNNVWMEERDASDKIF